MPAVSRSVKMFSRSLTKKKGNTDYFSGDRAAVIMCFEHVAVLKTGFDVVVTYPSQAQDTKIENGGSAFGALPRKKKKRIHASASGRKSILGFSI